MTLDFAGRRIAVVTGACGGMGVACCRQLGKQFDLVIADMASDRLARFAEQLKDEGYRVADWIAGDLRDPQVITALLEAAEGAGTLELVVHTAGFTAIDGDWRSIVDVNLVATGQLLRQLQPRLIPRSTTILIASIAGHMVKGGEEVDRLLDDPLQDGFLDKLELHMLRLSEELAPRTISSIGYALAKRAVIRMCEKKGAEWAESGARIVSISPGAIWTSMSRREIEAGINAVARVREMTPLGRWGTAMDIAETADFLASPMASFINGCDLRVDGGVVPALAGRHF